MIETQRLILRKSDLEPQISSYQDLLSGIEAIIVDESDMQIGNPISLYDLVKGSGLITNATYSRRLFTVSAEDFPNISLVDPESEFPRELYLLLTRVAPRRRGRNKDPKTFYDIYKKNLKSNNITITQTPDKDYLELLYNSSYILDSFEKSK